MIHFKRIVSLLACAITLGTCAVSVGQPFTVEWLPMATGNWNVGDNWEDIGSGNNVPTAAFAERAEISNGGTAQVSDPRDPVGAVDLGPGKLEILSTGSLDVDSNANVNGSVSVLNGGSLSIESGGTLNAESVTSVGTMRFIGPAANVSSANNLVLGGNHTLVFEINGATNAPILVGGSAAVGGQLDVPISGVTPSLGNSWDIIDANQISGSFSSITSPGSGLSLGQVLGFRQQPGGTNGTLGQVFVDQRLVLSLDRETKIGSITNPGTTPIAIDGYTIQSTVGSVDPNGWSSLDAQGFDGDSWAATGPGGSSSNALAELNPLSTSSFPASHSTPIGSIFDPNFITLGQETEDLTFSYTMPGFDSIEGVVDYVGDKQFNNVVLTVDPNLGEATMQNESELPVSFDGYTIVSASNSLLAAEGNWNSLEDQGASGGGWFETATVGSSLLAELKTDGVTTLSEGNGFPLGTLLKTDGSQEQDLVFELLLEGQSLPFTGVVVYGDLPILGGTLTGDFDASDAVDLADLNLVLFNWVQPGANLPQQWVNDRPDGNVGLSQLNDVLFNWGSTASLTAPVPEPASLTLAGTLVLCGVFLGRCRGPQRNNLTADFSN